VDPESGGLTEQLAAARRDPLIVGARLLTLSPPDQTRFAAGGFDGVFAAAQEVDLPLCLYPVGTLPLAQDAARRFPGMSLVIDHLGLAQRPFSRLEGGGFARLDELLALAAAPNVTVKLSGLPTLTTERFPYPGVWPHVHRVLEAFGPERVMWGSDCTRTEGLVSYRDGIRWLADSGELSPAERELVLGATLRRVFAWPAAA
jgi:L-fuconolactonase